MKHLPTCYRIPPENRPRPLGAALCALLAFALVLPGCVSSGAHETVVNERDRLAGELKLASDRVRMLEASSESLDQERATLANQVEDLRIAREELDAAVKGLSKRSASLAENLQAREAELAARTAEVGSLRSTYDGLVDDLQSEVASGRIEIEQLREGVNVKLAQEILFPSGSAQLSPQGRDVIRTVAGRLTGIAHLVDVNGHTDGLPIRGSLANRYPSNWELAGARASSVVRLLEDAGVPSDRLAAISRGSTEPVASNGTEAGRAKNRRIEIRLRPRPEAEAAPVSATTDG